MSPTARREKESATRIRSRTVAGKVKDESVRKRQYRQATINIRVSLDTRDLIDTAAQAAGKSRTEFVLDSARQQAVDVLLDQTLFRLDDEAMRTFLHVLDNPPEPNALLRDLMSRKAPWEG